MAENSLKDLSINWVIGGLLLFSLLAFAITFMYNNNSTGLNDGTNTIFNGSYSNLSNNLVEVRTDANTLLNITANTNPEVSDLGSRDSVAVSYSATGSSKSFWTTSRSLLGWVFAGTVGQILTGVIGGAIGLLGLFYIWRFIKTGT